MTGLCYPEVPRKGLVAWYSSSALGQSGNGAASWKSSVGSFVAKATRGSVKTVTTTGNGAKGYVRMATGTTTAAYSFGNILTDHYTICSMTRYTGSRKGRILTGTKTNWLHGHWSSRAGVAYYGGWLGSHSSRQGLMDWVVLCGTSKTILLHGKQVASRGNHVSGNQGVVINTGVHGPSEPSDWGVAEVITWNRALSTKEMQDATAYLKNILSGWSAHSRTHWLSFWGLVPVYVRFRKPLRTCVDLTCHVMIWDGHALSSVCVS